MAKCNSCSAQLPANSNRCNYCGIRNDVDLTGRQAYSLVRQSSGRACPHCAKPLQTVELHLNGILQIDRCSDCFGLFFDPGKIEVLLEDAVSEVFEVNVRQLDNINKDRFQANKLVKYIKCPVCATFMDRRVFGYRSGVIIDQCRSHGIWLDSGEVTHLLEWKKAGGQLLVAQKDKELAEIESKKNVMPMNNFGAAGLERPGHPALDALDTLVNILDVLFKA